MLRSRRALLAALLVLALVPSLPTGATTDVTTAQRLYLLQSDAGFSYWGVDPTDPELDSGPVTTAGPTGAVGVTTQRFAQVTFAPASVFAGPVKFDAEMPLRFHVELDVFAAGPYQVQLSLQKAGTQLVSEPAVEISPGVFEGTLAQAGSLGGGPLDMFVVRVTSMSPVSRLELRTGGASWIELPTPVAAHSVPQLLARSPRPSTSLTYTSATRSLTFNDDDWAVRTFSGTLDAVRTFTMEDPRHASAVIAWLDMPDTPPLSQPLGSQPVEPRTATDAPTLVLFRDEAAPLDIGGRSASAMAVPGGQLSVRVQRSAAAQGLPYTLHVLRVYGERTLQQMRWRFPASTAGAFTAMGGTCGSYQSLPTTSAVTTFAIDVDAGSPNPISANGWTPMYDLPGVGESPCGSTGHRDEVRITAPGAARTYRIGAAPQRREVPVVTVMDTMLELDVRFAHAPALSPEGG